MKKYILILLSFVLIYSCQTDEQYENLNTDPINPSSVSEDALFTSATKSLFDQMTSTNVNVNIFRLLAQYWTETTYTDEANYDFNGRNITQTHWGNMYRNVLFDLKDAKSKVENSSLLSANEKAGRIAQIEVLSIYTWQQLVDSFGDIPYSEALDIENHPLPAYDDAGTIYTDLIARLNAALPSFDTGSGFSGGVDQIYGGDMDSWKKFGNSLLLKLGLRIADAPGMSALAQSSITAAVAGGVFTSNADNASIQYQGFVPNTNPVWVDLVQSGRSDFVAANTLVDFMNGLNDPRRAVYFRQNVGPGVYVGGDYGGTSSYTGSSQVGDLFHQPTTPASLLDFAEVSFYLADAAERSISGTPLNAEAFYNAGITASFDYYLVPNVGAYLLNPDVAYTTAPGTWKEKIGNQMWIAMYNRGFEGWTSWRVYDTPTFNLPVDSGDPVPTRYTYPVNEQNLNVANWTAGSAAIGGDNQTTKLFWDVN